MCLPNMLSFDPESHIPCLYNYLRENIPTIVLIQVINMLVVTCQIVTVTTNPKFLHFVNR